MSPSPLPGSDECLCVLPTVTPLRGSVCAACGRWIRQAARERLRRHLTPTVNPEARRIQPLEPLTGGRPHFDPTKTPREQPARLFEKVAAYRIAQEGLLDEEGRLLSPEYVDRLRDIYAETEAEWMAVRGAPRNALRDRWRRLLDEVQASGDVEIVD